MFASASSIVSAIAEAVAVGKQLIEAGKDVVPLVELLHDTFAGKNNIKQEDLDKFAEASDELSEELDAELPEGE